MYFFRSSHSGSKIHTKCRVKKFRLDFTILITYSRTFIQFTLVFIFIYLLINSFFYLFLWGEGQGLVATGSIAILVVTCDYVEHSSIVHVKSLKF